MEDSTVSEVGKKERLCATLFADAARAYLSIQASCAADQRFLSDAGYQEGMKHHNTAISNSEMSLLICSYV